jgi:serine/threonine-protein kinase
MQLKRLGPYEIDRPLGKGGMGSVFSATDTQTGQRVAIKALTPHLALAEGFRERFEAEIESLKTLRHEGIVRLYGYGEQDGVLFYSMELVEGTSLEDELKAGRRFNWREVTSIAIQLSLALKHAHDHGVIHRDIKPANVLLFGDDRVKLADFGIARLFGSSQLTTAGGVLGTADYMSPEQADGRPVSHRCDQYSLGGVMYALLAGRPPFRAKNLPQMLQLQRFAEPEPVRRFAPDTPEQLERLVLQLLAKDPAARFPNMQVLARHLQAMYMALSRPAADDFALASEDLAVGPAGGAVEQSLQTARTQDESALERESRSAPAGAAAAQEPSASGSASLSASQNAATLAADDASQVSKVRPETGARSLTERAKPPAAIVTAPEAARASRFTTMEEEAAMRGAEVRRSWPVMLGQLAGLAAVLIGMVAAAIYLSRPSSADELYGTIAAARDKVGGESLTSVEPEIAEFLRRFPDDERSDELRQYERLLKLDQGERKLQAAARRGRTANAALLPAEELYIQAVSTAQNSPAAALKMFESLAALYGAPAPSPSSETGAGRAELRDRELLCVALAERRMESLHKELAAQIKGRLESLEERMAAASELSASDRSRAAAMYRAMIDLHEHDDWAEAIVAEARRRLDELQKQE